MPIWPTIVARAADFFLEGRLLANDPKKSRPPALEIIPRLCGPWAFPIPRDRLLPYLFSDSRNRTVRVRGRTTSNTMSLSLELVKKNNRTPRPAHFFQEDLSKILLMLLGLQHTNLFLETLSFSYRNLASPEGQRFLFTLQGIQDLNQFNCSVEPLEIQNSFYMS